MKKIIFFVLVICAFSSCSNDNPASEETTTPLLQKVIFNASSANDVKRQWNFNEDGLLDEITDGNDALLQTFIYNSEKQLTHSTIYNANGTTTNLSFAYNDDGSVYSLNNVALQFDAVIDAYYFGDLNSSYRIFKLNADGLLTYSKSGGVEVDDTGTIPFTTSQSSASYTDWNMTGHSFSWSFNGFEHDTNLNPLRDATLAVFKALAVSPYNEEWLNSFVVSKNNVTRKDYPSEYHIHDEYVYAFNEDGMPISATLNFFEMNHLDFSTLKTLYYYQGDVLP